MSVFIEKGYSNENAPICNKCVNYISGEKCVAFEFIPDLILLGKNNHSKPLDGQKNNIVFKLKNGR